MKRTFAILCLCIISFALVLLLEWQFGFRAFLNCYVCTPEQAAKAANLFSEAEERMRSPDTATQQSSLGLYRQAAMNGNHAAQLALGKLLVGGPDGIAKDIREGMKWLRLASHRAQPGAAFALGLAHQKDGKHKKALQYFLKESALPTSGTLFKAESLRCAADMVDGVGVMKRNAAWASELRSRAIAELMLVSVTDTNRARGEMDAFAYETTVFGGAQCGLGMIYMQGEGVQTNLAKAAAFFQRAAEAGDTLACATLAQLYMNGLGVPKNNEFATKWLLRAAEQGHPQSQLALAVGLMNGSAGSVDGIEAYKWLCLAIANGVTDSRVVAVRDTAERLLTPAQLKRAQWLAALYWARESPGGEKVANRETPGEFRPQVFTGSGFIVSTNGFVITAWHLIAKGKRIYVMDDTQVYAGELVTKDTTNDLALVRIQGVVQSPSLVSQRKVESVSPVEKRFSALAVSLAEVRLGESVATVGFPNPTIQGFSPKVTRGEISALSGAADDRRYYQISVPIQPGNSGGPLLDRNGRVVGVISARLSALASVGSLPQNVNYASKGEHLGKLLHHVNGCEITSSQPSRNELDLTEVVSRALPSIVLVIVSTEETPRFTILRNEK